MPRKKRVKTGWLWRVYDYKETWLDGPTYFLLYSFHWHFFTQGDHPVSKWMVWAFVAMLGAYWFIKEGVHVQHPGLLLNKRGRLMVTLWVITFLEFSFMIQLDPSKYSMPPYLFNTFLLVVLGWLGVFGVRKYVINKLLMIKYVDQFPPTPNGSKAEYFTS